VSNGPSTPSAMPRHLYRASQFDNVEGERERGRGRDGVITKPSVITAGTFSINITIENPKVVRCNARCIACVSRSRTFQRAVMLLEFACSLCSDSNVLNYLA